MKKSATRISIFMLLIISLIACEKNSYEFSDIGFSDCSPSNETTTHSKIIGNIFGSNDNYEFIVKDFLFSKKTDRFGFKICNIFYDKSLVNQQADLLCTLEIEKNIPDNRQTKASIKSIINLDEKPAFDPRYRGDGEKVVVYSPSNGAFYDTTYFRKVLLINSIKDIEKYKLKTKLPFDFSRYSLIGRAVSIDGCSSDFVLTTTVNRNMTSINIVAHGIGLCRALDFHLMFVKVPKITNSNNLFFNIEYKYPPF
jgi:hypothetical protein